MRIIGIDPGLRHTGYNVLEDGKSIASGTLVPPDDSLTITSVLSYVLPRLYNVIGQYAPTIAVVEEVAWYGRPKKITLPLSHVAGAIMGLCAAVGLYTYSLT